MLCKIIYVNRGSPFLYILETPARRHFENCKVLPRGSFPSFNANVNRNSVIPCLTRLLASQDVVQGEL